MLISISRPRASSEPQLNYMSAIGLDIHTVAPENWQFNLLLDILLTDITIARCVA